MRNPQTFGMISAALQSASQLPEEEVTPEAPEDIGDQTDDTSPETTGFTFGSRFGTKR